MSEVWMPKEKKFGVSLDSCAEAYRSAVKNGQFKNAKDWEKQLRELDVYYAKEGEP